MVDAPDDVAKMVERLSAPGTWARHRDNLVASSAAETLVRDDAPFEAAALIQSLSSQLAEARAEQDRLKRGLMGAAMFSDPRKLKTVEAERDRLAADLERMREALSVADQFFAGITPDANTQSSEEMDETRSAIAEAVRTALASLEDRA